MGADSPSSGVDGNRTDDDPRTAPLRILVVDDDPAVLDSMRFILELDCHEVTTVAGGRAGIDAFAGAQATDAPFGLVITDFSMPDVDGDAVAAAVKRLAPTTPVILITASHVRLAAGRDRPAGIDVMIGKPVPDTALRDAILSCARASGA